MHAQEPSSAYVLRYCDISSSRKLSRSIVERQAAIVAERQAGDRNLFYNVMNVSKYNFSDLRRTYSYRNKT